MPAIYTVNGRAARSALEFSEEQGGQRKLSCRYPEHTKGPEAVLAVRTGWSEKILGTVGRSFAAIFGGGGSGLAIILLV